MRLDALTLARCDRVSFEKVSTRKSHRPELEKLLKTLKKGDSVLIYKLDRLARSLIELVRLVNNSELNGIGFTSLVDHIDTTSASGKLVFHGLCSVAEFERSLISKRTEDGIQAAKKRGIILGRPTGTTKLTLSKVAQCKELILDAVTITEACDTVGISRTTFYRYQRKHILLRLTVCMICIACENNIFLVYPSSQKNARICFFEFLLDLFCFLRVKTTPDCS